MPRVNPYPALVEKFCRTCGKRGEVVVISRNQGRNYYFCCEGCWQTSGSKGPKKSEISKVRPDAPILRANVELPADFKRPVNRERREQEVKVETMQKVNKRRLEQVKESMSDREAAYWAALRKSYGLQDAQV